MTYISLIPFSLEFYTLLLHRPLLYTLYIVLCQRGSSQSSFHWVLLGFTGFQQPVERFNLETLETKAFLSFLDICHLRQIREIFQLGI